MLLNYIKIAWRNLRQNKSYTIINIIGLTVGMACCILIALYIREELSFDTFNKKADHIVAIGYDGTGFGRMLATPYPMADALKSEATSVDDAARFRSARSLQFSTDGKNYIKFKSGIYTESNFFSLFTFSMVAGNPESALSKPNSIVLTRASSKQLFGDANPLGQTLYWQKRDTVLLLQVTGMTKNVPRNSSIRFDALISMNTQKESSRNPDSWHAYSYKTFALLKDRASQADLSKSLQALVKTHYSEGNNKSKNLPTFFPIPLTQYHLSTLTHDNGFTGNRYYLYLFGSVALLILVIACVNYINLATAHTSLRSKEVGVRKTMGARRIQVAGQFLGESIILSLSAFFLSISLAELALPFFNNLFGTTLHLITHPVFLLWMLAAAVGVGLMSGLYPSLYLSGFSPISVLRGRRASGQSGSFLRKTLVATQFAIALVLITGSIVIFKQLQYVQTTDLGFDGNQVVTVPLSNQTSWQVRDQLKNDLSAHSGIKQVSIVNGAPGDFHIQIALNPSEFSSEAKVPDDAGSVTFSPAVVDNSFLSLLHIKLLAGRNFSSDLTSDKKGAYILNKLGAEKMGWTPQEAVGKEFSMNKDKKGKVIGVVDNFHIQSLKDAMRPIVLQQHESSSWSSTGILLARLSADHISDSMEKIKNEIQKYAPHSTFNYEFLDQKFDAMYRTDRQLGELVGIFTIIAILIACLGLYGLAAFAAERRTKEIGIRKVLGATTANIITLLSKDFLKLVVLGFVIAIPIAWFAMHRWLANFAYHINIGIGIFALAGSVAVFIALATVSWQSIRAALDNPVESLRNE